MAVVRFRPNMDVEREQGGEASAAGSGREGHEAAEEERGGEEDREEEDSERWSEEEEGDEMEGVEEAEVSRGGAKRRAPFSAAAGGQRKRIERPELREALVCCGVVLPTWW